MEQLITARQEGATQRYYVYDQEWTQKALEELWAEHGILFRADGVVPVMIRGSILTLGIEDDGVLSFGAESPSFHAAYAGALAALLEKAKELLTPPAGRGDQSGSSAVAQSSL
ncbi:MAG: hypothetical protein IKS05_05805 [Oscillospiraceae bacterium]|nr:hypothetical protein [Oscillospiraceae bacterium]